MTDHEHPFPALPATPHPDGTTVDVTAASALIGAALANCSTCRAGHTGPVADQPDCIEVLAGVAFLGLSKLNVQVLGTPEGVFPVPPTFSDPSRQVFSWLFVDKPGDALRVIGEMDGHSRRAVIDDMLNVLIELAAG